MRLPSILAIAGFAAWGNPAPADTPENLALMADRATGEQTGIRMAQDQAANGNLLDALSTLERVLIANPQSKFARLLHAIYLCRIDDHMGGAVEIGKFDKKEFAKADIDNARAQCGMAGDR